MIENKAKIVNRDSLQPRARVSSSSNITTDTVRKFNFSLPSFIRPEKAFVLGRAKLNLSCAFNDCIVQQWLIPRGMWSLIIRIINSMLPGDNFSWPLCQFQPLVVHFNEMVIIFCAISTLQFVFNALPIQIQYERMGQFEAYKGAWEF